VDGTRPTFEEAFEADYAAVVRVVAPIVGSVADAEGVTQDAFLKALTRWRTISQYDRPGAWVRRVAIRDAVRFAERRRRHAPAPAPADDTEALADQRLDLLAALRRVPARQRACIVLHHLDGWTAAEVADALGCSEATVRVHLHRGRTALAAALRTDVKEPSDGPR
jgi:RNA polymerase sigma-70 factor (ECF subfamily)